LIGRATQSTKDYLMNNLVTKRRPNWFPFIA
jgi:hypothetical protein